MPKHASPKHAPPKDGPELPRRRAIALTRNATLAVTLAYAGRMSNWDIVAVTALDEAVGTAGDVAVVALDSPDACREAVDRIGRGGRPCVVVAGGDGPPGWPAGDTSDVAVLPRPFTLDELVASLEDLRLRSRAASVARVPEAPRTRPLPREPGTVNAAATTPGAPDRPAPVPAAAGATSTARPPIGVPARRAARPAAAPLGPSRPARMPDAHVPASVPRSPRPGPLDSWLAAGLAGPIPAPQPTRPAPRSSAPPAVATAPEGAEWAWAFRPEERRPAARPIAARVDAGPPRSPAKRRTASAPLPVDPAWPTEGPLARRVRPAGG